MKLFQFYLEAVQNKKLWLDDDRLPIESNWTVVQNQKQFENAVRKNRWLRFSEFSFDNDLGTENGSGYDCAWFLINEILDYISQPKNEALKLNLKIRIHSHNPVDSKQIYSLFSSFFKSKKEDGSIAQESIMELILLPAIPEKEFFIHNKIISLAIRRSITSVTKQQKISCGRENCSNASAAFVYHANTGKTVKAGITKKWKDGESGPWYLAYVVVNGAPHNVAYNSKTEIIVDLTLGQFENYEDLKAVVLQKENYLSLINSEVFNIQKLAISDTLQVLYKQLSFL